MDEVRQSLSAQASLLTELLTQAAGPILRRNQLTFAMFELLSAVKAAGVGARQVQIARRLGITPPTLTEAVRVAKDRGLLQQDRGTGDNRTKNLALTPLGESIVQEILQKVNQAEQAMVVNIDPAALKTTVETLERANRNLAKALHHSSDSS